MNLVIVENHQPLPVKLYGGIERISLFHFLAQAELGVHKPTLICLEGSTVSHANGRVVMLSKDRMNALLSGKLPLRDVVDDCDILLTNNPAPLCPVDLGGTKAIRICVCHGDFREPTGMTRHQFFLTEGQMASHQQHKPNFNSIHEFTYLVANGLDPSWFQLEEGPHTEIVWFSSIDARKGPHIVGALADHLERDILAAGNGDPSSFRSNRVRYVGPISREQEKSKFFSFAEVYLHTAHHSFFNDPCPTTVLEAQMCGIPVVGLRSGGLSEIVYDKRFVFESLDDLAKCLQERAYLELDRQAIREWCAEKHSHLAMAKRYNEAFAKVLERG